MCGIAGLIDWRRGLTGDALRSIGHAMNDAIAHRGPDGADVWVEAEAGAMFAHRRLAIIDLTPGGAQPMQSADGRYVITFNGEIYNYRDIRRELEAAGRRLRSDSDTEVLLEACALWGVRATVERCIGMFAFGLWDRRERKLALARDRLGIKPLYYAATPGRFMFASQLKAFRPVGDWKPSIDADALVAYLRYGCVPQPHTIYREASKLAPGHILTVGIDGVPEIVCYWNLREIARAGLASTLTCDETEMVERLDALLRSAVGLRMIADVPLGAFLSGGIDSSTVVSLMQAQSTRPVKTFSIGFHERGYDEAAHAKRVAAHLKTDHTEFYVTPQDALDVIPHLPDWFDEPFADPSQIPTYLMSKLARQHVTVALSGDGGDEAFAGYNRYFWTQQLATWQERTPKPLMRLAQSAIRALSPTAWDRLAQLVPAALRPPSPGDKLYKFAAVLGERDATAIYRRLVSQWQTPADVAIGGREPASAMDDATLSRDFAVAIERMQYLDMTAYLSDDILVKFDRASMAVGLEGRVPLLDHRVIAFSWTLPLAAKVQGRSGKKVLRRVLGRYVPAALVERPKMGFAVPIDSWLRGPLRDWAEMLLAPARLADGGLRPEPIQQAWREHLSGRRNWQYQLWTILMFQAWRERWESGGRRDPEGG